MSPCPRALAIAALLALAAGSGAGAEGLVGEHGESWWREQALAREDAVAACEDALARCAETEAPEGADVVDGYGIGRHRGRPVLVPLKRCDEERAGLEQARSDLERFEEVARRAGVPPGWLR
jgi:hypothetical protein